MRSHPECNTCNKHAIEHTGRHDHRQEVLPVDWMHAKNFTAEGVEGKISFIELMQLRTKK